MLDYHGQPLLTLGAGNGKLYVSQAQYNAWKALGGSQRYHCLYGGTRSGKTLLITRAIVLRALAAPNSRHAILRFRANAARAAVSLDTLPTVMRMCFQGIHLEEHRQDGYFELHNGSQIWVSGLDDKDRVEKILGLEFVSVFLNEASQIPWASAIIALTRVAQVCPGLRQRAFVDLNPVGKSHWTNVLFGLKENPHTRTRLSNPEDYIRATLGPIDNSHALAPEFIRSLEGLPEKQRKRFFEGVYVDEVEGALWTYEGIEQNRCTPDDIPVSSRQSVVVAVDPSGAASKTDETSDEIGIIVAAKGTNGHGYVLADRTLRASPIEWARVAVHAYHEFSADRIVAEKNFGGEMVRTTIRTVDPNVPVQLVTASRGKAVRAEPISARYEKGEVHHVGRFPDLEDQLCAFSPSGYIGDRSPDRADAAIWALTDLLPPYVPLPIVVPYIAGVRRHNPFL